MSKSSRSSSVGIKRETSSNADMDDDLMNMEPLDDRESPEMWNNQYADNELEANATLNEKPPSWIEGLKQDDINYIQQLAALSPDGLIAEIRKLYDDAYMLGIQEAKEMTRGRWLNILQGNSLKKSNK